MAVNAGAPAVSIVGYRLVPPDQLLAHPLNARRHPAAQRESLRASLRALGWIAPVVVNLTTGHVVDGHARVEEALSAGAAVVPVVEVELTPEQEALALAVYDPITSQAIYDREALDSLLRDVSTDETSLQQLLDSVAAQAGLIPPVDPMAEWQGMPEYVRESLAQRSIHVHFKTAEDVEEFAQMIGQPITDQTSYLWHPAQQKRDLQSLAYSADDA